MHAQQSLRGDEVNVIYNGEPKRDAHFGSVAHRLGAAETKALLQSFGSTQVFEQTVGRGVHPLANLQECQCPYNYIESTI